ncbi:Sua5/YciO/YrdC/YwlC family protein [Aquibium sp. A9E412]|uniref:Sua5/YciO/YrdC/YwlC family protein n=1 Tax=Aquibium sp. A9E412 TaxID=2976767 RepID=UPI0025AF0227|nr:Sua5/YciO/YrdC/YwlC family protein [Aquibium sp. A9E412]MDN2567834.1 Sua5/YciO/YrdC/YwlC family protein [Aquibium sp. A9E412]
MSAPATPRAAAAAGRTGAGQTVLRPEPPLAGTADAVAPERLAADVAAVLERLWEGGVAIVPLDVAYAIIGHRADAIRRIFAAKQRSYDKPSGLLADWRMSAEIHRLPDDRHAIVRTMVEEVGLPFSVVAPYDPGHRFFARVDPFVMANSSKAGTLDMLLNAGQFHDEIARQSWAAGRPVFGSSANTSLKGSKYRLDAIEPAVRAAADICADYGLSRHANDAGRSSTIIDFRDFSVIRVGVAFDRLKAAFRERFDIALGEPAA